MTGPADLIVTGAKIVTVDSSFGIAEAVAVRDDKIIAVGGAAYLVAKAITKSTVIAFPELGMEAIHEFEVKDMPVTLAVDARGTSIHIEGPKIWSQKIAGRIDTVEVE